MQRLSLRKWVTGIEEQDSQATLRRERHSRHEHSGDDALLPTPSQKSENLLETADELTEADAQDVERASGVNPRISRPEILEEEEFFADAPPFELTAFIGKRWGLNQDASSQLLTELVGKYVPSSCYEISVLNPQRQESSPREPRDAQPRETLLRDTDDDLAIAV
ncbi:MAG TPA: hypothetical protein VFQ61_27905 [Polyangiaceae bacterium]|nr:hypothetical protein [Polyangiaceae bacterium]